MDLKQLHTVYFLGIGGIGMSAIARYFKAMGCHVVGYDKTKTQLTTQLEAEGIIVHYEEDVRHIPNNIQQQEEGTLVVYTPAIPQENKLLIYFKTQKTKLFKRSEVLGLISQNYFTIAIAGTHGKTTTSSIVAHILNECGKNCIAFLGGISLNFNSNLLLSESPEIMVVEADEFDRSFLTLSPTIALITSIEADHLDIYGSKDVMKDAYSAFAHKINNKGTLISKPNCIDALSIREDIAVWSYSGKENAMTTAQNVSIKEGSYYVDVVSNQKVVKDIKIGLPGIHNVENAIGAFAIADQLGLNHQQIKTALGTYKGVYRRFETHVKKAGTVYIDDYAHHPSELKVCIQSARELYPNKKITGIFQPHLYTRTRDFMDEFAASLSLLDELILLDIYPARELPIAGVSSKILLDKVTIPHKQMAQKEALLNTLSESDTAVLLTLGAGDIDVFVPQIKALLNQKTALLNE